jgi:mRNA interferase RelE/StbE
MSWNVSALPTFLKELARLPQPTRKQVEKFAFDVLPAAADPLSIGKIEKLTGHRNYYKIRFGDYRVGLQIDRRAREVRLCRVLHRRDIYRRFP